MPATEGPQCHTSAFDRLGCIIAPEMRLHIIWFAVHASAIYWSVQVSSLVSCKRFPAASSFRCSNPSGFSFVKWKQFADIAAADSLWSHPSKSAKSHQMALGFGLSSVHLHPLLTSHNASQLRAASIVTPRSLKIRVLWCWPHSLDGLNSICCLFVIFGWIGLPYRLPH